MDKHIDEQKTFSDDDTSDLSPGDWKEITKVAEITEASIPALTMDAAAGDPVALAFLTQQNAFIKLYKFVKAKHPSLIDQLTTPEIIV